MVHYQRFYAFYSSRMVHSSTKIHLSEVLGHSSDIVYREEKGNLKTHQQSKHEGVKYSCIQCEYQATAQGSLRRHQQYKHNGVRFV